MCTACCNIFTCPALSVASPWRSVKVMHNGCCVFIWSLVCVVDYQVLMHSASVKIAFALQSA